LRKVFVWNLPDYLKKQSHIRLRLLFATFLALTVWDTDKEDTGFKTLIIFPAGKPCYTKEYFSDSNIVLIHRSNRLFSYVRFDVIV